MQLTIHKSKLKSTTPETDCLRAQLPGYLHTTTLQLYRPLLVQLGPLSSQIQIYPRPFTLSLRQRFPSAPLWMVSSGYQHILSRQKCSLKQRLHSMAGLHPFHSPTSASVYEVVWVLLGWSGVIAWSRWSRVADLQLVAFVESLLFSIVLASHERVVLCRTKLNAQSAVM